MKKPASSPSGGAGSPALAAAGCGTGLDRRRIASSLWRWLLGLLAVALLAVPGARGSDASGSPSRVETWTDREGRAMEAAFGGYDSDSGEVLFDKGDGTSYRYPLRGLDSGSRWRAVAHYLSASGDDSLGLKILAALAGAVALVAILCFAAQAGIFWAVARLLTGMPGVGVHLRAFVKLVLLGIGIAIISLPLVFFYIFSAAEGAPTGDPGEYGRRAALLEVLVASAQAIASTFLLRSHYGIGVGRAFAITVTAGVASFVAVALVMLAVTLLFGFASATDFGEWEMGLIEWILGRA